MSVRTSITPEQKKRRFRALTREENLRIGSQYEQEFKQLFLPFNEFNRRTRAGRQAAK
jgi:hypothetical protein